MSSPAEALVKKLFVLASLVGLGCVLFSAASAPAAPPSGPTGAAATERVSVSSKGAEGNLPSYPEGISADGRYVVFTSGSADLVPGDTNRRQDAFVHDRKTGTTVRVSLSSSGRQGKAARDPFGGSAAEGMSADGRDILFRSDAANLVARDTNNAEDLFVRDRKTGRTSRVSISSRGRQGNGGSLSASISANGRYVAFTSDASNLVPGDRNRATDIFVHDRKTGRTGRISVSSRGREGNSWSDAPTLSADGRYVAFTSAASNLVAGDTNRLPDVFVRDRARGKTRRASLSSRGRQGTGKPGSNGSNAPTISADGRYVAFHSDMPNLVPGDTNRTFDIFVNDRVTRKTERVSVNSRGRQANAENLGAPSISAHGRYVAFASLATNLVPGDKNDITDAFVRDRKTGRTLLVSLSGSGAQGTDASWPNGTPAFSAGNRYLVFASWAGNLVPGDNNGTADAFVRDLRGTLSPERTTSAAPRNESASAAKPFAPRQEPRGIGNLVVPGDRVEIAYDAPGFNSTTGTLYVRNDLRRRFERLALKHVRGPSSALQARVPARLIHGHRLFYYAVIRDPRSRRSATVPAAGARAPGSAWILEQPVVVRLGTHRFGHTRWPGAIVARARADEVGWQNPVEGCGCGPSFGPETFVVGRDRSIWLHDGLNDRMLVWRAGRPDAFDRSVPLPPRGADNDVALGPGGAVYVTGGEGRGAAFHPVLYRLNATGRVLWKSRLAGEAGESGSFAIGANSPLRTGPDGTLYLLTGMFGRPGGEPGWMPVATPAGKPLSVSEQRRRTHWPDQPVAGGLRIVSEVYVPPGVERAPHEARYALLDRRGRVVRAWRVLSRTDINFDFATPALVGGDPVVVLDATAQHGDDFRWEYVVLRLGRHGARTRFSLPRAVFGDNLLADLRVGPDGKLYQMASSPDTGIVISRYSLGGTS
jgi:Tol biopolymer transport system component